MTAGECRLCGQVGRGRCERDECPPENADGGDTEASSSVDGEGE